MMRTQAKAEEIDDKFLKAYGVGFDAERTREVVISNTKTQQIDNEFDYYLENRPSTPEAERKKRKDMQQESDDSDSDDSAKIRQRALKARGATASKLA